MIFIPRKDLVSVQRITSIEPHENADSLLIAHIQGWMTVIGKNDGFKVGDLCVYFQTDSIMPARPEFEYLKDFEYRVRTVKLRGVRSQGLVLPLNAPFILETLVLPPEIEGITEGMDVTELLGIQQYEKEMKDENAESEHPTYICPKNDELNINPRSKANTYGEANAILRAQGYIKILDELRGKEIYITKKMDGTTSTFYRYPTGEFAFSSKKNKMKPGAKNYWNTIAEKYHIKEKLDAYFEKHGVNLSVHGEICGPGIQKNRIGLKELQLYVFGIFDITNQKWLDFIPMIEACREMDLPMVPIMDVTTLTHTMKDLEKIVLANKYEGTNNIIEGIVIRLVRESEYPFSKALGERPSFKILYEDIDVEDGGPRDYKKEEERRLQREAAMKEKEAKVEA